MKRISLIVPVYNGEAYLLNMARSVLEQDWENLQVLFSDDGSTDGSADLLEELAGRDPRVQVISGENGELVQLGVMGEVHPDVAEQYGMDGVRIYCCELMFDAIRDNSDRTILYTPLPKYPSTSRDIALLVEENLEVGRIEALIRKEGGRILENVKLFDVYRGKQVEEGKKSVAFTLTYRDKDKTLTDEDVAKVHNKVLEALEHKLNAVLREM